MSKPATVHEVTLSRDEAQFYEQIKRLAVLPSTLRLPKFNLVSVVSSFASENEFLFVDASSMFDPCCDDAAKVDTAVTLLSERSKRFPKVIHFARMTEYNVEAFTMLDVLLQYRDLCADLTDAICVGKFLLHAICVVNGETIKIHDAKRAVVVRQILSQIQHQAECAVCLAALQGEHTVIPFACGHSLCYACGTQPALVSCPLCRESKRWNSMGLFRVRAE